MQVSYTSKIIDYILWSLLKNSIINLCKDFFDLHAGFYNQSLTQNWEEENLQVGYIDEKKYISGKSEQDCVLVHGFVILQTTSTCCINSS